MPTLGIDVSAAQGELSQEAWNAIAAAGIEFAYLKATEGQGYLDAHYVANRERARAAGLLTGAYHYFWATRPAYEQAMWFHKTTSDFAHELPPVMDFESMKGMKPVDALYRAHEFLATCEGLFGRRLVFYTYPSFWWQLQATKSFGPIEMSKLRDIGTRDLWIAHYGVVQPNVQWPWTRYFLWQFDGDGGRKLPSGVDADFNWYDGSLADLRAYCGLERDTDPTLWDGPASEPTLPETPTSKSQPKFNAVTPLRAGEGELCP